MTDSTAQPLLDQALAELALAVEPLRQLSSAEDIVELLRELGLDLNALDDFAAERAGPLVECLGQMAPAAGLLIDLAEALAAQGLTAAPPGDLSRVGQAASGFLEAIGRLPEAVNETLASFPRVFPDLVAILEQLPRRLLDYLVIRHLRQRAPRLYGALLLGGLIDNRIYPRDNATLRPAFVLHRAHWERLPLLVREPQTILHLAYGWGGAELNSDLLLARMLLLLRVFGISAGLYAQDESIAAALGRILPPVGGEEEPPEEPEFEQGTLSYAWETGEEEEDGVPAAVPEPEDFFRPAEEPEELSNAYSPGDGTGDLELRIPLFRWQAGAIAEAGLNICPIPGDVAGLAILPYGLLGSELRLQQGAWELALQLFTGGKLDAGILIRPDALEIRTGLLGEPAAALEAGFQAIARRTEPAGGERVLLGSPAGTRVSVAGAGFGIEARVSGRDGWDLGFRAELKECKLVVAPGDGDGFLQAVLPAEPLVIAFDLEAGYSRRLGLHLGGGPGLDHSLAVNRAFGPLFVDQIDLRSGGDVTRARFEVLATGGLALGPLTVVVENVGLRFDADLTRPGLLGFGDLDVGFRPPTGLGLTVDASQVRGGGYLFFDIERQQYAGVLQLKLAGKIGVSAVGLLATRLPDGSPGFSLFVLITAQDFAPLPLGYGFTLNGIGGLLGLNRTALTEVLRSGLRQGTLDHVLFPADPLRNAPALVSALNAVFPPARDRFLFGPLAIIGWGTPTILTLKLALILELPDPVRLVVLGRLAAVLPDAQHPLVHLQMDAIGELDFRKGSVALDATLNNSRLLEFVITGDMALRAGWGASPYFVMAVGGFHPRFPVPAGFPLLDRLGIIFADSEDLRLRLEAYLALTSNTAQFGARLDLHAVVGGFSLDGMLGFDTLFQFVPFGFAADVGACIAVRYGNTLLAGIALAATLSGPAPQWHLHGKATFHFGPLSYPVELDARFGRAEPPPLPQPVDVGVLLRAALADRRNWGSELPAGAASLVTLRDAATGDVVAHPLARLTVRQRVVPLGYAIDRLGSARPSGERVFHVEVTGGSGTLPGVFEPLYDDFAPGQFRDLSDDDKLRLPAFEKRIAGYQLGTEAPAFEPAQALEAAIAYEGPAAPGLASRVFLPWVRQGLPALLRSPDPLAPGLPARMTLPLKVWVNDPEHHDESGAVAMTICGNGPGDVLGIDPDLVVRTEPRHRAADFEPNYFPFVEFARADFPWLFTPAGATADGRLRPWLCLVVVRLQDLVRLGHEANRPLPVLECPRSELPNLEDSWAWAHTQILRTGPDDGDIATLLRDRPDRAVSRLLSPRRLDGEMRYLACLVPAFEAGRKAGLGEPLTPADEQTLSDAWSPRSPDADPLVRLPVYYHWEFRTGAAGDFEALLGRLAARPLAGGVGFQPVDISAPGWGMPRLPADTPGAVLSAGGALRPLGAAPGVWPDTARLPFEQALDAILHGTGSQDPVVKPPRYGQAYAQSGDAPRWLRELNLDPRYRLAAGLGAMVVRHQQETLVAEAWRQYAAAVRDQETQRRAEFGSEVAGALREKLRPATGGMVSAAGLLGAEAFAPAAALPSQAEGSLARRLRVRGLLRPGEPAAGFRAAGLAVLAAAAPPQPEPRRYAPVFTQSMFEPLRDHFAEWLMPGLDGIPQNTLALLETDDAFIEAYLVGLNHELGRELLWREFPVDVRGTFFRRFWSPLPGREGDSAPLLEAIADWAPDSRLGGHLRTGAADGAQNQLMLLLRGDLLQRFPNAEISAVRAVWAGDGDARRREPGTEARRPLFRGGWGSDVTLIGFALTGAEVRGTAEDPGWFFVIREREGDARFGLDAPVGTARPPEDIAAWDRLSWDDLVDRPEDLPALVYVSLAGRLGGLGELPLQGPSDTPSVSALWGHNGAHMAAITQQAPVCVAIHASAWLPQQS